MYRIIHIGLNSAAMKQLDELRQVYPNIYNRQDVLLQLLAEAHQKYSKSASTPKLQIAA